MKIQILLRDQGDATTPWFFIKKYTCLCKQIFPYSWWLFKYLSLQILILHFYTGLNCSLLLLHVSHQIKLYFKNFLQVCTFLSQTPVTFALCESILPPWYLYWFFFFLEWRYNCITFWNWDTDEWFKKSEVKNVSMVIKID